MNLERITARKNRTALLGAALCILTLVCGADGGIAYLREPFNSLRMLPGESMRLTGPMAPGVADLEAMTFQSDSGSIAMNLEELISGFWLGARMWRGTLRLSADIEPGKYLVSVYGKEDQKKVGDNTFQIIVYKDLQAYLSDSKSLIQRYSGFSPWSVTAFSFLLVLLTCGLLYLLAGKRDRLMAEQGEAEIYHITKDDSGLSVYFGLGERNGVEKGSVLLLMDSREQALEEIMVDSVSETDAVAKVGLDRKVRTGFLVKKI
ncbi:MAG: hypothetical protein AB9866_14295 [Syntrophobacteraceae bacterium]